MEDDVSSGLTVLKGSRKNGCLRGFDKTELFLHSWEYEEKEVDRWAEIGAFNAQTGSWQPVNKTEVRLENPPS